GHVHRWRRKRALSPLVKAKPEIVAMGGDAVSAWRCVMAVCDDCAGFRTVLRVRRRCDRGHVDRWRREHASSPRVEAKPEIIVIYGSAATGTAPPASVPLRRPRFASAGGGPHAALRAG